MLVVEVFFVSQKQEKGDPYFTVTRKRIFKIASKFCCGTVCACAPRMGYFVPITNFWYCLFVLFSVESDIFVVMMVVVVDLDGGNVICPCLLIITLRHITSSSYICSVRIDT